MGTETGMEDGTGTEVGTANGGKPAFEPIISGSMEQRIAIAEDVIKQIEAGRLVAVTGRYVTTGPYEGIVANRSVRPVDAQHLLPAVCNVCVRGAILLTMIDRYNSLRIMPGTHLGFIAGTDDDPYMNQLFPDAPDIEAAYEGFYRNDFDTNIWMTTYPDDRDRLVAIMQNLVRNEGRFVSSDVSTGDVL